MTIRHLKIFIKVYETGKMNQAAKELFISQPSVSQAISELEQYYGFVLFERLNQKLYKTDNADKLLPLARHIVEAFDEMDIDMKKAGQNRTIKIGASVTVGTCYISKVIDIFEKQEPNTEVFVTVNNTSTIENMITNSQLDIAIVEGLVTNKDLVKTPLFKDELVVVVGKGHPFYNKQKITASMLDGQSVISREDGSMVRNQFEIKLLEYDIKLKQKWKCTNTEAIKNVVSQGKDIAILSRMLVTNEVDTKLLKVVNIDNFKVTRDIELIYHKDKFISNQIQRFIDISKEYLK